ncbi:hypothetical protein GW796_10380 [archaeon]|nr:hypothetical protein [archaeon]
MEENKDIVLAINSILNKNLFYSNKDSLLQKSLDEFHLLFNNSSTYKLLSFLDNQKENELLLKLDKIENIKEIMQLKKFNIKNFLINFSKEEILIEYKEIKPLEHVLPFKLVSSLMIDKKFFSSIDVNDHSEVRKELLPITQLIHEMSNNGLLLNDINFEFSYTDNKSSGFCNKNKIFVQCNQLNSSSLKHEYFHAMDITLAKKLNVETKEDKITFSEFNDPNLELKEFNRFIKEMDKNKSSQHETKENLNLYFQKYLPVLNQDLSKIKEEDIPREII